MTDLSVSIQRVFFVATVLFALMSQSAVAADPDAKTTTDYLNKVSDIWLEYHCLIQFGKTKDAYSPDPGRIKEKWEKIGALDKDFDKNKIDQRVQAILWARAQYEQLFQSRLEGRYQPHFFFLDFKEMASTTGGTTTDDNLEEQPDENALLNRNRTYFDTFLKKRIKTSAYMKGTQWARRNMIKKIRYEDTYTADEISQILATLNKPFNLVSIVQAERKYLNDYHPDLLRARNIDTLRAIKSAKSELEKYYKPEYKQDLLHYRGAEASLFFQAEKLSEMYSSTDFSLPELALAQYKYMQIQFFKAFRESMEMKARDSKDVREQMAALQMSTLRHLNEDMPLTAFTKDELLSYGYDEKNPSKYSSFVNRNNLVHLLHKFDERVCINPFHPTFLAKQAQIAPEKFGFIGFINTAKRVKQMELSENGSRLVVLEQDGVIEIVDLKTGKITDPIYSLDSQNFEKMAITANGKTAYVIGSESKLFHIDLDKKEISEISQVKIPREDTLLSVSPKGDLLAVGVGYKQKMFIYNTKNWKLVQEIRSPGVNLVYNIRFSPDGRKLLVRANARQFWLYNAKSGKMLSERAWIEKWNKYTRYLNIDQNMQIAGGSGGFSLFRGSSKKPHFHIELKNKKGYLLEQIKFDYIFISPNRQYAVTPEGVWDIRKKELQMRFIPRVKYFTQTSDQRGHRTELIDYKVTPNAERIIAGVENEIYVAPLLLPKETAIPEKSRKNNSEKMVKADSQLSEIPRSRKGKPEHLKIRRWKDSTGKKKVKARLISFKDDIVVLKTEDDEDIKVPLERLSRRDRRYVTRNAKFLFQD